MFQIMPLVLVAALLIGIGLLMQKRGLERGLKAALRSPIWLAGTVVGLGGFGLYILTLNIERVAIIQPMVSLSLLFVALAEIFMLGEKATLKEIGAICMFLTGILLIAVG